MTNPHITLWETLVSCEGRKNSGKVVMTLYGSWIPTMDTLKSALPLTSARSRPASPQQEVRCAVRFPLALPVVLTSGSDEIAAVTRNVSASGVVFELDSQIGRASCRERV